MLIDTHVHIFPEIAGIGAKRNTRVLPIYDDIGRLRRIDRLDKEPSNDNTLTSKDSKLSSADKRFEHSPQMLISNMDWAQVDKAVLLQAPFYGKHNDYVAKAVKLFPERLIGTAYLDPWDQDCHGEFEKIVDSGSFKAIKIELSETCGFLNIYPNARLTMPEIWWLWKEMEKHGLILVFDLGAVASKSYQTDEIRQITDKHPDLKIAICHLAQPTPLVEANPVLWEKWKEQIDLGKLPNVWFDTASLPAYVQQDERYPYPSAGKYIRIAIDRIGPEKIMWGTDLPMTLTYATYPEHVKMSRSHVTFLSAEDQRKIFAENAMLLYGI